MQFEESWYYLQLTGFNDLDYNYALVSKGDKWISTRSKKHHGYGTKSARDLVDSLFTDKHIFLPWPKEREPEDHGKYWLMWLNYHEPVRAERDSSIPIEGAKECIRCKRTERLERDHILALHLGGKDISQNLQWLCYKCHKFKTAKDKLTQEIPKHRLNHWRRKMWEYRLEALSRLNPPEAEEFHSYGEDPRTLWDQWSIFETEEYVSARKLRKEIRATKRVEKLAKIQEKKELERSIPLESFI